MAIHQSYASSIQCSSEELLGHDAGEVRAKEQRNEPLLELRPPSFGAHRV